MSEPTSFWPIAQCILDPNRSAVDLDRELRAMKTEDIEKRLSGSNVFSLDEHRRVKVNNRSVG